jgi:hypothetical protein
MVAFLNDMLQTLLQDIREPLISDTANGSKVRRSMISLLEELKAWMNDSRLRLNPILHELMQFIYDHMDQSSKQRAYILISAVHFFLPIELEPANLLEVYVKILETSRELLEKIPVPTLLQLVSKFKLSDAFIETWNIIVDSIALKKSVMTHEEACCFWHACIKMSIDIAGGPHAILVLFHTVSAIISMML